MLVEIVCTIRLVVLCTNVNIGCIMYGKKNIYIIYIFILGHYSTILLYF